MLLFTVVSIFPFFMVEIPDAMIFGAFSLLAAWKRRVEQDMYRWLADMKAWHTLAEYTLGISL